jgi:hypothetical protein
MAVADKFAHRCPTACHAGLNLPRLTGASAHVGFGWFRHNARGKGAFSTANIGRRGRAADLTLTRAVE